jgi:hypothetical protein
LLGWKSVFRAADAALLDSFDEHRNDGGEGAGFWASMFSADAVANPPTCEQGPTK